MDPSVKLGLTVPLSTDYYCCCCYCYRVIRMVVLRRRETQSDCQLN